MSRITTSMLLLLLFSILLPPPSASADDLASLRVLDDGQTLDDHRREPLKDLHGYFPFDVPKTPEAWRLRAGALKRQTLVATGLWPMPERTPLNAVVHSRIEREGFTVEKVYFESLPGFFVTGQLFRPVGKKGPFPIVLCPHGHGGRLMDTSEGIHMDRGEGIHEQIANGEERYVASGRFSKLARCAQLARMGCVVLIPDMIGYADNTQLPFSLVHRFTKLRPQMEAPNRWGLFSTQADLRLQSVVGLQTWNNIRALDFLTSLPDVDASRLGVTGSSGGGTQTILLNIVDPRPAVAFPQGMVSTSMQGGCTCENCSLLRVGTGNVELAALFAPKPQAMTAANDWTIRMMTHGFPELQELYSMIGNQDDVQCTAHLSFPHNYNYVTRSEMYEWFNRYLNLGSDEQIEEQDYEIFSPEELTVWDKEHPQPTNRGDDFELELVAYLTNQSNQQIAELKPTDESSLQKYREIVGGAVKAIIGRTPSEVGFIQQTKVAEIDCKSYLLTKTRVTVPQHREEIVVLKLFPKQVKWNGQVVLWLTGEGKQGLFAEEAKPIPAIEKLLSAGFSVMTTDLFGQGEAALAGGATGKSNRLVSSSRGEYAGFTYGYNSPLLAQQAHDVLSLVKLIQLRESEVKAVHLVGTGSAGLAVLVAGATIEPRSKQLAIDRLAVEIAGFRFRDLKDYRDARFLPGIVKYGDVPALVALNSTRNVFISDVRPKPGLTSQFFDVSQCTLNWNDTTDTKAAIVDWLLDRG